MKIEKANCLNKIEFEKFITNLLCFLKNARSSLDKFRYFSNRKVEKIKTHSVSLLGFEEGNPISYGHLKTSFEKKDEAWLGICIAEGYTNKGYGKEMLKRLIKEAKINGFNSIKLVTDNDNLIAKSLYCKMGFKEYKTEDFQTFFFMKII